MEAQVAQGMAPAGVRAAANAAARATAARMAAARMAAAATAAAAAAAAAFPIPTRPVPAFGSSLKKPSSYETPPRGQGDRMDISPPKPEMGSPSSHAVPMDVSPMARVTAPRAPVPDSSPVQLRKAANALFGFYNHARAVGAVVDSDATPPRPHQPPLKKQKSLTPHPPSYAPALVVSPPRGRNALLRSRPGGISPSFSTSPVSSAFIPVQRAADEPTNRALA